MLKKETAPRTAARRRTELIVGIGLCLLLGPAASLAQGTAQQRAACTPDVLRLCSSEIPSVNRIVACLKAKKSNLRPSCRSVFEKTSSSNKGAPDS
jgi:hypothetical protein